MLRFKIPRGPGALRETSHTLIIGDGARSVIHPWINVDAPGLVHMVEAAPARLSLFRCYAPILRHAPLFELLWRGELGARPVSGG